MARSLEELIKESLVSIGKEREIIDTLIVAGEKEDGITFEALRELFKQRVEVTDGLIKEMVDNYSQEEIDPAILEVDDLLCMDTFDRLTLYSLQANYYEILCGDSPININTVYEENNNFKLYSFYYQFLKDHELSEKEQHSLREFILLRCCQSLGTRAFFKGDEDTLGQITNPELYLGPLTENYDPVFYGNLFNETVEACNRLGEIPNNELVEESIKSRRLLFTLEFTVLCAEFAKRNLLIDSDVPITEYTKGVLEEAAALSKKYININPQKKLEDL